MARGHFKNVCIAITPLSGGSSWNFCGERVDYDSEDEGRLMILRIALSSTIFGAENMDMEEHIYAASSVASRERDNCVTSDTSSYKVKDELLEEEQDSEAQNERVVHARRVAKNVVAPFKVQPTEDYKVRKKRGPSLTGKRRATKKRRFAASRECLISSEAISTTNDVEREVFRKPDISTKRNQETGLQQHVGLEDTTPDKAKSKENAFKTYLAENKDKMNVFSSIYPLLRKMIVHTWSPLQAVRQGLLIAKFYNPRFEALAKPYTSLQELLHAVYDYYEANSRTPVNTEAHAKTGLIDDADVTLALSCGRHAFVAEVGPRIFAALDNPSVANASASLLQGKVHDAVRLLSELPFCSLHWAYLTLAIASDLNADIREALERHPYIFDCKSTMDLVDEFCDGEYTTEKLCAFAKRMQSDTFTVQRRYWVFKHPPKQKYRSQPTLEASKEVSSTARRQQYSAKPTFDAYKDVNSFTRLQRYEAKPTLEASKDASSSTKCKQYPDRPALDASKNVNRSARHHRCPPTSALHSSKDVNRSARHHRYPPKPALDALKDVNGAALCQQYSVKPALDALKDVNNIDNCQRHPAKPTLDASKDINPFDRHWQKRTVSRVPCD